IDLPLLDSLANEIIAFYEDAGWDPDMTYVNAVSQRAAAMDGLGRRDSARAEHERAIALFDLTGDTSTARRGRLLNNLALHYHSFGEYAQAEPLLRESVDIDRTS